jgi:Ca2+-dependent lipid-binding protein
LGWLIFLIIFEMAKKWIQKAIKRPGAFTKKAKKAGMSISAYARKVTKKGSKASTRTKRQANLAKTLKKINRKRKKRK